MNDQRVASAAGGCATSSALRMPCAALTTHSLALSFVPLGQIKDLADRAERNRLQGQ